LLGLLVLAALIISLAIVLRFRERGRPVREARRALANIEAGYARDGDHARAARAASELVRRYIMSRFPAQQVAGLSGERWAHFLVAHCPLVSLGEAEIVALVQSSYSPEPQNAARLIALAREVIDSKPSQTPGPRPRPNPGRRGAWRLVPGRGS
jgi:hypothetical protein